MDQLRQRRLGEPNPLSRGRRRGPRDASLSTLHLSDGLEQGRCQIEVGLVDIQFRLGQVPGDKRPDDPDARSRCNPKSRI
jgi:hypothetical protein